MGNFRIRAYGQMGVSFALGVTVGSFEIQDTTTLEIAMYDCATADTGPTPKAGMTVLSSWSDLPPSDHKLEDYWGAITLAQATAGVFGGSYSQPSVMRWLNGPAKDTTINTTGWVIGTPAISASAGYMRYRGKFKPGEKAWTNRWATVAIWHSRYRLKSERDKYWQQEWAIFWGRFDLTMEDASGISAGDSTWVWQWAPNLDQNYQKRGIPTPLWNPDHGIWKMAGGNGSLKLSKSDVKDFATLEQFEGILDTNATPRTNERYNLPLSTHQENQSNGTIWVQGHDYPILWLLTALTLPQG
jgi:hypothetical protein